MTNRRNQVYEEAHTVDDIPQHVYHDVVASFEYMNNHNFILDYNIDEEQSLVNIYNSKYAGKEIE